MISDNSGDLGRTLMIDFWRTKAVTTVRCSTDWAPTSGALQKRSSSCKSDMRHRGKISRSTEDGWRRCIHSCSHSCHWNSWSSGKEILTQRISSWHWSEMACIGLPQVWVRLGVVDLGKIGLVHGHLTLLEICKCNPLVWWSSWHCYRSAGNQDDSGSSLARQNTSKCPILHMGDRIRGVTSRWVKLGLVIVPE